MLDSDTIIGHIDNLLTDYIGAIFDEDSTVTSKTKIVPMFFSPIVSVPNDCCYNDQYYDD